MKTVCISMDDAGGFSVGELPPDVQTGDYLQPAPSMEEAFAQAQSLLSGGETAEQDEEAAFREGFGADAPPQAPGGGIPEAMG